MEYNATLAEAFEALSKGLKVIPESAPQSTYQIIDGMLTVKYEGMRPQLKAIMAATQNWHIVEE